MKRALLVTAGTVAGLVSVLAYSPLDQATAVLSEGSANAAGLGAPPAAPAGAGAAAPDAASASQQGPPATSGSGRPAGPASGPSARPEPPASRPATSHPAAASSSTGTAARTSLPAPATPTTSAAPSRVVARPTPPPVRKTSSRPPAPRPTTHTPTPPPTPAGPHDYTGSAVTYKYGTLQMAIRVVGGRITDAWAVTYPQGSSQPYSEMAIPILRSQTIAAQSAHISGATGASLTSASWITSLTAALTAAGLR
ncbi:MAG TPA: hypothetical protein VGN18_01585 [Jatrophihabitans sp.]|jgi:uncharacterized protein with FMN-binding domain|uniref:FMN-binding protein n=1 Tax=Jatrophihabitans sp. TaxID=1932789 RepID=UPI002E01C77E|nr:hypothetical protein [Jatrophihabitans sp.]